MTFLSFKDQKSADQDCRQFSVLERKIDDQLQPVFTSKKIIDDLLGWPWPLNNFHEKLDCIY